MSGKYWHYTAEANEWLHQHSELTIKKLLPLFVALFPEYAGINAKTLQYHRYSIHASNAKGDGNALPLYTERKKKGQLKIKIAQPNVWENKSRWVYEETHPEELADIGENDLFLFWDDNKMNYDPDNIFRISKADYMVCNRNGGLVGLSIPDKKLLIARVKLRRASLDAGEKCGLVSKSSGGRYFKDEEVERHKKYRDEHKDDPDYIDKQRAYNRRYYRNMTPDQRSNMLDYQKKYKAAHKDDPHYIARNKASQKKYRDSITPERREHINALQRKYRAERKAGKR